MQKSVIDAVAPDARILAGGGACHAGHRCRAASRVEAHRSQMTGQTHTRMRATPACGSAPSNVGELHDRHQARRHDPDPVSYTHLRAHETDSYLVCRLLLE